MYKLSVFDLCLYGPCSGVAYFFTEKLEPFEEVWLPQVDEDRAERYLSSKNGEIVTDYYSDAPELNIVQYDEKCEIISKKSFDLVDKHIIITKIYDFEIEIFVAQVHIELAHIKHLGKYYLIGKYKLSGLCQKDFTYGTDEYVTCLACGNPIVIQSTSQKILDLQDEIDTNDMKIYEEIEKSSKSAAHELFETLKHEFGSKDPKVFEGCDASSCCWVQMQEYENREDFDLEKITEVTDEMFDTLMRDI